MTLKVVEKPELGKLVTPIPDKRLPVYGWFLAKESFSRGLVMLLAETWGLKRGDLVLDPFCGCGTTLLACRELGVNSIGYDVHPMMLFASRVKLADYDHEVLLAETKKLLKSRFEEIGFEAPNLILRAFHPMVLKDIVFFREMMEKIDNEKTRDFMKLALVTSAMECSWVLKDGAAIKTVKRPVPPFRGVFRRHLTKMISDLKRIKFTDASAEAKRCDARALELDDSTADAVITSPPYLQKREYLYSYRVEEWLAGLKGPNENEVLGGKIEGTGGSDLPPEAAAYLEDMRRAIGEIYRVAKSGCRACMVVSDACFRDGVMEVCMPLSKMAEDEGFSVKRIIVVNRRYCTTPSRKKLGQTKEALLIWEK